MKKIIIKNVLAVVFILIILTSGVFGFLLWSGVFEVDPIRDEDRPAAPRISVGGYDGEGGTLYLSWPQVFNVTVYYLYQSTDNINFIKILTIYRTTAKVHGLQENRLYYFKAVSEYGNGIPSHDSVTIIINSSLYYNPPM